MRVSLRRLLLAKLVVTALGVVVPCLLVPMTWFDAVGLPLSPSLAGTLFVRLFGAAVGALCVCYGLALLRPAFLGQARIVAMASNLAMAAVVWTLMFQGVLEPLPFLGKLIVVLTSAAAVLLAALFAIARGDTEPVSASTTSLAAVASGASALETVIEPEIMPPAG